MIVQTLKNLQTPLIVFLICFILGTVIYISFYSIRESSVESMQATNSALQAAKTRYNRALEQKRVFESFETRFKKLVKGGVFSKEDRLNWIDAIETTSKRYQIPYLKYKIQEQSIIKSTSLNQAYPGIEVYKSPMVLEMQLLHEGDLYSFINGLKHSANGLFDVEKCAITRNLLVGQSMLETQDGKNFSSICTLNWYTIQKKTINPAETLSRRQG